MSHRPLSTPSPFVIPPATPLIYPPMENPHIKQMSSEEVRQKHDYVTSVLTKSRMTVNKLKNVLKALSLGTTGLKHVLQERLVLYMSQVSTVEVFTQRVNMMHDLIKSELGQGPAVAGVNSTQVANSISAQMSRGAYGNLWSSGSTTSVAQSLTQKVRVMNPLSDLIVYQPPPIKFADSPFYSVKEALMPGMVLCKTQDQRVTRFDFKIPDYYIKAVEEEAERRKTGTVQPKYAIRVFGQILQPEGTSKTASCEFPIALQFKINDKPVEANTRGMKNKRGTTVPPDLSDYVNLSKPTQRFETYYSHCPDTRFGIWICIVDAQSMTQVLENIMTRRIPKEKPLQMIRSFYSDEDVMVDNYPLKLKCPISYSRMELPVRSVFCKHVQCFDGKSFLQMQLQAAQWRCPVCDDPMSYKSLAIDEFMSEILQQAPEATDNVVLLKDGSYEIPNDESDGEESSPEPEWAKRRHPDPPLVVSLDSDDDDNDTNTNSGSANSAPAGNNSTTTSTTTAPVSSTTSSLNGTSHTPLEVPPQDSQDSHPLPAAPATQSPVSSRPERSGSTHSTSSIPEPKRRRTSTEFALPPWGSGILGTPQGSSAYPDVYTMIDDNSDSDNTSPIAGLPPVPPGSYSQIVIGLPSFDSGIFKSGKNNTNQPASASPDTAATSVSPQPNGNGTPLGRSNAVRRGPRPQKTVVEVVDLTISDSD